MANSRKETKGVNRNKEIDSKFDPVNVFLERPIILRQIIFRIIFLFISINVC